MSKNTCQVEQREGKRKREKRSHLMGKRGSHEDHERETEKE